MRMRWRPWHAILVVLGAIVAAILLWGMVAYGGLPRLWSRHEHKRIGARDAIQSYTAQDIPADPINLALLGDEGQIACAFRRGGWTRADAVTLRSSIGIAKSVMLGRADPAAPVSPLYVDDRQQDQAWQLDDGVSADRRHHVRLWQVAPGRWWGAASFDKGVGLSLFTLQVTHRVGPDMDAERALVGRVVTAAGGRLVGQMPSRIAPGVWHRNGGGSRYRTDGQIAVYRLGGC